MKSYYLLKEDNFKLTCLSILFSFHLFFWDVKIINNYGLREAIAIINFYIIYDLIKNKFFILKKNIKSIIIILLVILFFSTHLFINSYFDNRPLHLSSFQGLVGFSSLLFILFFYYDFIKNNLKSFINIFLVIYFLSFFFSDFKVSSLGEIDTLCASYFAISNKIIFIENSHLAMVFNSCIGYLLIKNKDKSFLLHIFLLLILIIISYLQSSATFYVSLVILTILILILDFEFFVKKFIFYILIFTLISVLISLIDNKYKPSKFSCSNKISESSVGIGKFFDNKLNIFKKNKDTFISTNEPKKKKKVTDHEKNKTIYELSLKEKIDKNITYTKLLREYPEIKFNLSTSVLLNALNISFETLKNRPLGWGLNRYEYAFDYYMFNYIVKPYWYHEVYTLNYNDGSANIPKLITEFGIISFFLIPFAILFLLNRKINNEIKLFFLMLVITQLIRGAGFFNGGFMFSLIFMIFTVLGFFKKND